MTIREIFKRSVIKLKKAGIPTAELDTQLLVQRALHKDEIFLINHPEYKLTLKEKALFYYYLKLRQKGLPIAYILNHKEFYSLDFMVDKNVLIPRPESEWLVETALNAINKRKTKILPKFTILDIGTGSGCLVISLIKCLETKYDLSLFDFNASDISKKALEVATNNARKHHILNQINFYHSNLFTNSSLQKKRFDLIIANLPYVPEENKDNSIRFEPKLAIFAKDNGARIIERFLDEAKSYLNQSGVILIELDPRNAVLIKQYANSIFPNKKITLNKDLAGLNRYLTIRN